jgi:hypothetical protein
MQTHLTLVTHYVEMQRYLDSPLALSALSATSLTGLIVQESSPEGNADSTVSPISPVSSPIPREYRPNCPVSL